MHCIIIVTWKQPADETSLFWYIMHYAVERPADSECIAWYTLQETISHCEIYDSEVGLVSL